MIVIENNFIKGFSNDDEYIIGKSLIDAWGYPYRPLKIELLDDRDVYKEVDNFFSKNHMFNLKDFDIVINALELLYFENLDFEALYDGVTKDDVKTLYEKLKQVREVKK